MSVWSRSSDPRGFTLIELLLVIAIIIVVATFMAPALNTVLRGTQLSQASQLLQSELALARQRALASDHDIEVRLVRYADPSVPGETAGSPSSGKFRAMQSFEYADDGTAKPVGKLVRLPGGIIMDSSSTLSTLLDSARDKVWGSEVKPALAEIGTSYDTRYFRFRPDGSTDLSPVPTGQQWFVTLHGVSDGDNLTALPPNFATVQVDPVNGRNRLYRP